MADIEELTRRVRERPGHEQLALLYLLIGSNPEDVARQLDRLAPLCPGGCGCRLGTDDADRRECGCDEGCCE